MHRHKNPDVIPAIVTRGGLDPFCIERREQKTPVDLNQGTEFRVFDDSPGWVYAQSVADQIQVWRISAWELRNAIRGSIQI